MDDEADNFARLHLYYSLEMSIVLILILSLFKWYWKNLDETH